ncbi:MAG: aldehyde dehydrogenase family protein [Verrucomicrobia bacterium]|nr:MAG: aldehyde dehydrogenase family protein [Verrucomicrobiota bacterium]
MNRLPITKTPKCYVGGAFIRSESGRTYTLHGADGKFHSNIPACTRKDVRNAVEAAAKAGAAWAQRNAYNRGQILYRIAEMLEARKDELASAIALTDTDLKQAKREVEITLDRIIHYAGWTDKFQALLGSVNPVSSAHFNFTVTEPMGIIGILAPEQPSLLGLLSMILPAISAGNSVVALASESRPYPSILLGEILATSDLPGGVVNLLTGSRKDMLETFASHAQIRAVTAVANLHERTAIQSAAAECVKRVQFFSEEKPIDWESANQQGLYAIRSCLEFKTTWHPVGV